MPDQIHPEVVALGHVHPHWPVLRVRAAGIDGGVYEYRGGAHEALLFLPQPDAREAAAVQAGETEFALVVSGPVIFLLARYGDLAWTDMPYSIHLVPPDEREVPELEQVPKARQLFTTVLIDSRSGVVRALRVCTWSPAFTRAVHAAIREQAGQPYTTGLYQAAVSAAYRRWPNAEAMLSAATVRTKGGA